MFCILKKNPNKFCINPTEKKYLAAERAKNSDTHQNASPPGKSNGSCLIVKGKEKRKLFLEVESKVNVRFDIYALNTFGV